MKVVAVLPAYNAEKTLHKTYQAIPQEHVDEIILVDDASHDHTVEQARTIDRLVVLLHKENKGYGGNQKTCYSEALQRGADIIIMIHPDFQYDPKHVPAMIKPLQEGQADFVIGSRFLQSNPRQFGMDWWRYWGNRLLTTIQNYRLGTALSECHSGYRAYTRRALEVVPYQSFSDNFVFDSQFLTAAARLQLRITEVPVEARYATESSSISFLKSVRYGLATLKQLW